MAAPPVLVEISAQLRVGATRLVPGRREDGPATEVDHELKIDISYNQETGRLLLNLAQLYEWRRKPLQGYTWADQAVRSVKKLAAARGCAAEALFEWMPGETTRPGAPPRPMGADSSPYVGPAVMIELLSSSNYHDSKLFGAGPAILEVVRQVALLAEHNRSGHALNF